MARGIFLGLIFAILGAESLLLLPRCTRVPKAALNPLIGGVVLTAAQSILITTTLSIWQDATRVNVIYSLRGLAAIALVHGLGQRFQLEESRSNQATLAWRTLGALLILGAVFLAVTH